MAPRGEAGVSAPCKISGVAPPWAEFPADRPRAHLRPAADMQGEKEQGRAGRGWPWAPHRWSLEATLSHTWTPRAGGRGRL